MAEHDPYLVLGVPADADTEAIAAAYRSLARRYHPDVSSDPDAQDHMARINAAWSTLRDPVRRAHWDAAHLPASLRAARLEEEAREAAAHPASGHGRHTGTAGGSASTAPGTDSASGSTRSTGQAGRPGFPGVARDEHVAWRRGPGGEGAAGPPPGPRMGTVLPFGRHIGWSVGEIARADPGYLVWLKDRREGAPYREEIERVLRAMFPSLLNQKPGAPRQAKRGRFR